MSVTFTVRGAELGELDEVNFSNNNARQVLEWLGVVVNAEDLYGSVRGRELRKQCLEALRRPVDPALPGNTSTGKGGAVYILAERREGYLHDAARKLLRLAELAGDLGTVDFN